jgi:pimeloyl-ACP methyl ester carboxylesterase
MQIFLSRHEIWSCAALFLILLGVCLWPRGGGVAKDAKGVPIRVPCSRRQAQQYVLMLQQSAEQERLRQWMDESLASQQASWLLAKAEFALERAKRIGKGNLQHEEAALFLLEDTWRLLLQASAQSRLGCPEMLEEKGARLRAYLSDIDQTFQTYSISIPAAYDPIVRWPLIVSMHGHGWYAPFQGHPAPSYRGAFCLSPQGRGATDYKDLGEIDVLEAIAEVKKSFNIDSDRVYLTGSSMGGTGSFNLAVHYADQFAGIFPIVGNADNLAWTARWGWNRNFPGRNTELRHWLQEGHSARAFAKNLFNLPSYILAGAGDVVVPPEHSRNMTAELRGLGYPVEYREFPGVGHGGFPGDAVNSGLSWTCSWVRNPFPRKISWRAALLKHGRAYWLRMEQFAEPLRFGEIEAEITAENRISIKTDNLLSFSLQRPDALFNPKKPLFLEIDGERVIMSLWPGDGEIWHTLRRDPIHGWDWENNLPVPEMSKKSSFEGPIQEVLLSPFLLVVGTQSSDPAMNAAWLREANTFAHEWRRRNNASCLVVKDVDCTMQMLSERNLILLGGPTDNKISNFFTDMLPLHEIFMPLRGKNLDLEASDIGYQLLYPAGHLAPGRLLVLLGANSPEGAWQQWGRFGNWFNWGVYDSKKYYDYAIFDARSASPETMLLTGWFGTDWSLANGKVYYGDEKLRADNAAQRFPSFAKIEDASGEMSLMLVDLLPSRIDQMRGAFGSGRSFNGENTGENDLGLRAPAKLEYRIGGAFAKFETSVSLHNPFETELCNIRQNGEKVRFTVYGDGKKLAERTVDWKSPTAEIEADITGVSRLRLETAPAGGPSWLHAGALWKSPCLIR